MILLPCRCGHATPDEYHDAHPSCGRPYVIALERTGNATQAVRVYMTPDEADPHNWNRRR